MSSDSYKNDWRYPFKLSSLLFCKNALAQSIIEQFIEPCKRHQNKSQVLGQLETVFTFSSFLHSLSFILNGSHNLNSWLDVWKQHGVKEKKKNKKEK